ncbi:MAG: hypothetical protein ACJAQT_003855 [Akkermansiaceae bacterium]|jgi:hypothetical protein
MLGLIAYGLNQGDKSGRLKLPGYDANRTITGDPLNAQKNGTHHPPKRSEQPLWPK